MKKKRQFFDECLTNEAQFRKANILRSQVLVDSDLDNRDINKRIEQEYSDIKRFDDCLNGDPTLLSRARELREIAKAELWWDKISDEKKEAIRDECVKIEPWIGNEIKIKWFLGRSLQNMINDEDLKKFIIFNKLYEDDDNKKTAN